ncbi:ester cyclase [Candidatus Amarolinea dominans]|uniref:ester cyclase n=1 Tax=Candidatus Amarolinea dominans TaxID=3140696 RepID=UPI001D27D2A0|nr:ester cyclase [Anaerolineae bacterium]MBK7202431.1 ester cyclase [Anaerolineae bacterium]MBK9093961.1 ester cyclase [Anaerolineae bacterium]
MSVQASATMPGERLVTDLIAAWNTHDLDLAAAFFAPDCVNNDVALAQPQQGRAGIRRALAGYFQAIPDVTFTLSDLIVAGERAVALWTARGTHLGTLMNIPASGRHVTVRGVSTFTLQEGQITKADFIWDVAGLLRAIGLLPEL